MCAVYTHIHVCVCFYAMCTHTFFLLLSRWFFIHVLGHLLLQIDIFYETHLSEIPQNNLFESKESFQMKVEMLL